MEHEPPKSLIKVSVAFEPGDYEWARARATELYGRRGIGLYIRSLVKEDCRIEGFRGVGKEMIPDPEAFK